jgi:two-component system, cell cycle sensor histidine kinase and response regulator CckA
MSATQILVVEDERLVAKALQNELEQFGYNVSGIASTVSEAVREVEEHRPDLVLMDIHLKGEGDGIEAGQRIQMRNGIPVIYLSAFADAETVARASETNAFGYLIKPYEERELQTTIEMALAKHRAEKRLEETRRWLAAIHNGIDDAVIATDPENNVHSMNFAGEALTGWPMEEAIGVPVTAVCNLIDEGGRIVHEDFADRVVCESRSIALPDTTRLVLKDGREIPVEGSVSPIYDSRGEFLGTVLVLRNIAGRLELERLRRQSEERAQRAQKMQSVGRLAGGLSHRLNDMLTAILGNTSLALTEFPADVEHASVRRLLQDVELAAQNAAELVERLGMFSAFAGGSRRELREIDLGRMIPDCLESIRPQLNSRIRVTHVPVAGVWPVYADEQLLGQAVLELAMNAQEAMRQGGQLTIELDNVALAAADLAKHPEGQAGQFVRLRIADSGRGIPAAVRDHLFEPFVDSAAWSKGRGLGMTLVLAVAEQHHGWVECHSQLGRGTQVDLFLPRHGDESAEEPASPSEEVSSAETGVQARKQRGSKTTILLADRDPLVRDVGRRILEAEGYRVLLAEDGGQAVAAYRDEKEQIDLAILDLNMPRLTAYVVMERLLEIDPEARVLFSGGYFTEDHATATELGHTLGVVAKPFSQREFVEAVRRALAVRERSP